MLAEQAPLPCFGGSSVEEEEPPPLPYDDDNDSVASDKAVTVQGIAAAPVASEVMRDPVSDPLEVATNTDLESLLDEVSSAVEFLAQFPQGEANAILSALSTGQVGPGQDEAVHFVESLIAHLPDRAAMLVALRHGVQNAKSYGGQVSKFLSRRQQHRMAKVRTRGNWEEHFTRGDEAHAARRYFYNDATQKTQWEPPPEFEELDQICQEDAGEDELDGTI
mmetsp:Transcript_21180/g.38497  ORF Transcript_21180/g.38497 Transcript_21180/m.38497 type:complete len:221 (+) Transcript_21180:53-715(+)